MLSVYESLARREVAKGRSNSAIRTVRVAVRLIVLAATPNEERSSAMHCMGTVVGAQFVTDMGRDLA